MLSDYTLEYETRPIRSVRVKYMSGRWYVIYRRKPRFFFDRWWWFTDSMHTLYNDAYIRGVQMAEDGYYVTPNKAERNFKVVKKIDLK